MKLCRLAFGVLIAAAMTGLAFVGQSTEPVAGRMTTAANAFLGSLSPEQKARVSFAFDDKERTNWFFIPLQDKVTKKSTRKGVPLEEMTAEQKEAALALVKAGTSEAGYTKAVTIMSLESLLHELEKNGAMVRNPGWYFFTIYGEPSKTGKWGWRVEGHHFAISFTLDKGRVIGSTPNFFGANPATVKDGPRKGLRIIGEVEDLARDLFKSLDEDQAKVALQGKLFDEIEQGKPAPNVGPAVGLAAAKMNENQKGILVRLLEAYTNRMPKEVAAVEMNQVKEAGIDHIRFAYAGGVEAGQPYTYRIHGPTFVVEFLNMQADSAKNPANHIHSAWRHIKGDFGLD